MPSKKSTQDPLSKCNLKRHAKKAWKDAYRNDPKGEFGTGRKGRASWFAGYAAALDWLVQMMGHSTVHLERQWQDISDSAERMAKKLEQLERDDELHKTRGRRR